MLKTHLCKLFAKTLDEPGENLLGVRNLLCVLADNPNKTASCIGLVQIVDTLAKRWYDAFIARIPSENILDDNDHLLHDIADFRVDQFQ